MKGLVAYFSASGTTKKVAERLSVLTNFDSCEITPKIPYTTNDLNWMDKNSRSSVEMKNKSSRPEILKGDIDVNIYDTILLGFPIWWYVAPTIINTFLESYDFKGKTIILFATSGGSGFGKTIDSLKISLTDDTCIKEGKIFNGNLNDKDLITWLKSLNLYMEEQK